MTPITLFTWGYWGWGNASDKFIAAADAVEKSRDFRPPVFVDIRIRRAVRAKDFNGAAFETKLPAGRHRWMKELGNKAIVMQSGPSCQIANPAAASDLLDLALEAAEAGRRLIFFCSCQFPRDDGFSCHRVTVAGLVLKEAKKRGIKAKVVEWPGGEPEELSLNLKSGLPNSRCSVPLGPTIRLARFAGLSWGSILTMNCSGESETCITGPALFERGEWVLPIWERSREERAQRDSARLRRRRGYEERAT